MPQPDWALVWREARVPNKQLLSYQPAKESETNKRTKKRNKGKQINFLRMETMKKPPMEYVK